MNRHSPSLLTPRAIQNARTRIFVPGSDPRFATRPAFASRTRFETSPYSADRALPTPRLFAPGLLDRLQAPLSRYSE